MKIYRIKKVTINDDTQHQPTQLMKLMVNVNRRKRQKTTFEEYVDLTTKGRADSTHQSTEENYWEEL